MRRQEDCKIKWVQYRGRLDQLMQEAQTDPTGIRDALTAQRKESIQRDAQGQKMAMERTLASRGVDPTSLKALTAIGGVDANVMQQNRMAQQSAGFDAQQMQQQRLNQRANLLQSGMNAVGQEQNFIQCTAKSPEQSTSRQSAGVRHGSKCIRRKYAGTICGSRAIRKSCKC